MLLRKGRGDERDQERERCKPHRPVNNSAIALAVSEIAARKPAATSAGLARSSSNGAVLKATALRERHEPSSPHGGADRRGRLAAEAGGETAPAGPSRRGEP